jgi:hypothetical protein
MATRSDIDVFYNLSPRLIRVAAPSTSLTIQDLHDTLRDIEDEPANLIYPGLVSTAGKEELGGGLSVGLTATLLNAQVMFERRTNVVSTGTITTGSSPSERAMVLIDASATFITDGVKRSDFVVNDTDADSFSEVLSVDSQTQLTVLLPSSGADNDFDFGDAYTVYEMVQCEISGGNLVAEDDIGDPLDPVFPTVGTQVIRTGSSSATLIGGGAALLDIALEDHTTPGTVGSAMIMAAYQAAVFIDATNGVGGTTIGLHGTPANPSNNLADALTISAALGTRAFVVVDGTLTLTSSLTEWYVEIRDEGEINFNGESVNGSEFSGGILKGLMSGRLTARNSFLEDVTGFAGLAQNCGIGGTITLAAGKSTLDRCHSQEPGTGIVTLSFIAGASVNCRAYSGGIQIENMTNVNNSCTLEFVAGRTIVDASNTAGELEIRGVATVTDNSTGTTVNDVAFDRPAIVDELMARSVDGKTFQVIVKELLSMANGRIVESPANTFTFYEQDNTTVRFVLTKAGSERNRS